MQTQVLTRLGDPVGTYYQNSVLDALNEGQRLFCLLTLSLETTVTFPLAAATLCYNCLLTNANFLLPRRIYNSAGGQLRPATIAQLQALDSNWMATPGLPTRYVVRGLDFLGVYPQPAAADTLTFAYARSPVPMAEPTDVPEIRTASHFALVNYASWALRQPEGGQEFAKFQTYFNEFMDEAQTVAELVKHRTPDTRAESIPFELARTKR
jgi:hypothetical protein